MDFLRIFGFLFFAAMGWVFLSQSGNFLDAANQLPSLRPKTRPYQQYEYAHAATKIIGIISLVTAFIILFFLK